MTFVNHQRRFCYITSKYIGEDCLRDSVLTAFPESIWWEDSEIPERSWERLRKYTTMVRTVNPYEHAVLIWQMMQPDIGFEKFICDTDRYVDGTYQTMVDILNGCPCDFLLRSERSPDDLPKLPFFTADQRDAIELKLLDEVREADWEQYYTAQSVLSVQDIFARDFIRFGYPRSFLKRYDLVDEVADLDRLRNHFIFNHQEYPYYSLPPSFRRDASEEDPIANNEHRVIAALATKYVLQFPPESFLEIGHFSKMFLRNAQHDYVLFPAQSTGVIGGPEGFIDEYFPEWLPPRRYQAVLCGAGLANQENPLTLLQRVLKWAAKAMVCMPLGYSIKQDGVILTTTELISRNDWPDCRLLFMRRVTHDNRWIEASWSDVRDIGYDTKYPCANALVVWIKGDFP